MPNISPAMGTGGQMEGMQYLGAGWIFLILLGLLLNCHGALKSIRNHKLLIVTLVGMAIYSLSNKIYFGNTLLFEYKVPSILVGITETFRGSGRFFWPMGYLLVAVAVVLIVRKIPKIAPYILCFAVVLQITDTGELRRELWNVLSGVNSDGYVAGKYAPSYSNGGVHSTVFDNLLKNHRVIRQYPSWWCGGVGDQIFELNLNFDASKYLVSQNSFYTARANKDCYAEDLEARSISTLDPDALYIFAQRYGDIDRLHIQGIDLRTCRILDALRAPAEASWYLKNPAIMCSEKIKHQQLDLGDSTQSLYKSAISTINLAGFLDKPVIRHVSASANWNKKLYLPENVIYNRIGENDAIFPDFWLLPHGEDGWIRLDLDGSYLLSEVRILNTNNGGAGDRAAGKVQLKLFGKNGAISYKEEVGVAEYPKWTSIKIDPPTSAHSVKLLISEGKVNGAGLNEIRLIGKKGKD
jgi:hypothetical protein